jgi:serine/threonine-protein kinase
MKVLHKRSISSIDTLNRFRLEVQAAGALASPHIVTVFDSNVSKDGEPYMVMDYLQGQSLDQLIIKPEAQMDIKVRSSARQLLR